MEFVEWTDRQTAFACCCVKINCRNTLFDHYQKESLAASTDSCHPSVRTNPECAPFPPSDKTVSIMSVGAWVKQFSFNEQPPSSSPFSAVYETCKTEQLGELVLSGKKGVVVTAAKDKLYVRHYPLPGGVSNNSSDNNNEGSNTDNNNSNSAADKESGSEWSWSADDNDNASIAALDKWESSDTVRLHCNPSTAYLHTRTHASRQSTCTNAHTHVTQQNIGNTPVHSTS